MNFDKIFSDFETARAVNDLDAMSKIFVDVNNFCGNLARLNRANEIPPAANKIANHVNVLIFHAAKLIGDGDGSRAKFFLMSLVQQNSADFGKFFYLLYLLARSLYLTDDFPAAAKIFERYDKIRADKFGDADELSLFYRANCFALTGDFDAAIPLYEKILAIKADFPEATRNLELARRRSTENFSREVKSLWSFPNWRDVPIFINARDRLGVMKRLIDWLLVAGYRKIFVLDNRSTYPPLLDYYAALENDSRIKIVRLEKNFGYKSLWQSKILERLKISTPYVYTDPDILPVEDCPPDFLRRLMKLLDENREMRKVGLGLVYDDINFFDSARTKQLEANFYDGTRVGDEIYFAQVDTTFALYSNVRHYNLRLSLRTTGDLRAYHLPWYFDYDNLPADEKYYLDHADKTSVTTVKKFLEE